MVKSTFRKPKVIDTYNKKMNGIDRSDQIVKHFERESVKSWKKLFFHLFSLLIHAFILYKEAMGCRGRPEDSEKLTPPFNSFQFHKKVISGLFHC